MICTFFGHRDTYDDLSAAIEKALIALIEQRQVHTFYVGNNGRFDRAVLSVLKKLKTVYPFIQYAVILAYFPTKESEDPTIYPEGLESVPRKFVIDRRNRWMVAQADYVITHVTVDHGGAAKFKALAERQGKTVINIP